MRRWSSASSCGARTTPNFAADPQGMVHKLEPLKPQVGKETLGRWMALAVEGRVDELFESVMTQHYDPCYQRSTRRSYGQRTEAACRLLESLDPTGLASAARQMVEAERAPLASEGR